MKLHRVPIHKLNPAPYNPRVALKPGDDAYEKLKRSIETFGLVEPIVVNQRNHVIVGGHQRFQVLKDLGHANADVVFVDLDTTQERALNLALNKITGDWDESKLASLLSELQTLPDFDVELTGFELPEIDEILTRVHDAGITGDDDAFDISPNFNQPAITKPGELLQLGQHRLLCGDSTHPDDVRKLMAGQRAVLFATDPPYLVNYDGTNHPGKLASNKSWKKTYGVAWDEADGQSDLYDKFIGVAVAEAITANAAWYCFHASRNQSMVEDAWKKHGAFVHQQIVWVKDRPVLNRSWYSWQHEPCFFGWQQGHKPRRVSKEILSTVWTFPTIAPFTKTEHPTSKPLGVFEIPMMQHTVKDDVCFEPFCGSGSQLIAAEKHGRRCFALEISPHYCDVIVRRWLNCVGVNKAPKALVKRYALKEAV